jgi:hypothetical protein
MATAKTDKKPLTVTFDPPDVGEPDNVNIGEVSMDDFAKVAPDAVKPPRPRGKVVSKRMTVEAELERLRGELERTASLAGMIVLVRDPWMGHLILLNRDTQIDNWLEVARINPKIRSAMLSALDMGVYATAISGSLALVIAAVAHMGMLPNSEAILNVIGGNGAMGVKLPDDNEVAATEAMFAQWAPDEDSANGNGSN